MKSCYLQQMDGAKEYNTKQMKSVRERQVSYDCTHMWNLINKKMHKGENQKETDLIIENELTVT